jgi:hypothetical protein
MSHSDSVTMVQSTNLEVKPKTKNSRKPKTKSTDTTTVQNETLSESTTVENTNENTNEKVTKPKVPTLSGKYTKFMQFGYWFANQISADEVSRDVLLKSLRIYDSVEVQTHFYKSFEDEAKSVAKTLRANMLDAKKQVKLAEKAALKAEKKAAKLAEKPPKVPRAKKTKNIVDAPTDVISQIVALAQSNEPIVTTSTEQPTVSTTTEQPVVDASAPKEKPKTKKVNKKDTTTPSTTPSEKPKRVYKKKNADKTPTPTPTPVDNNDKNDDDDDLDVDIVDIDGHKFLVDSDKNLYDFDTHAPLNRKL